MFLVLITWAQIVIRMTFNLIIKYESQIWAYTMGPKKIEWMKTLHGVLYGSKWIMFYGLPYIIIGISKRGGSNHGKVTSYILL